MAYKRHQSVLVTTLSFYVDHFQETCDRYIPGVLFAIRTMEVGGTGQSPFLMIYGRTPHLPVDISLLPLSTLSTTDTEFRAIIARNLLIAYELADQTLKPQKDAMVRQYNKDAWEPNFRVGGKVLLQEVFF